MLLYRQNRINILAKIKPAFRMREQEVGYKIDAGNLFCEKNGFEFMYIDEKYLKIHSVTLKEFKLLPQVEIRQIKT